MLHSQLIRMLDFFNKEEEEKIIEAIQLAERNTSGEIRVHIEAKCRGKVIRAAQRTFKQLGMHKTAARNGVLIFLAPERKEFAIVGDEGIDKVTPDNFWQEVKDVIQQHFRANEFTKGVTEGILKVGDKLKAHFPYQQDDINELPDDISYSEA